MKYLNSHRRRSLTFISCTILTLVLFLGSGSGAAATPYMVVDTAQETCYDDTQPITCPSAGQPFYGQDAQYTGHEPSYTLSNDSLTVYDNTTGLTWIRKPDTDDDGDLDTYDQVTWSEFLAYPATLNAQNFGGYNDWRAPSIKELYSLMDFRGRDPSGPNPMFLIPFIDTTYFDFVYGDTTVGERIIDAQYWSTNQYVGTVFGGEIAVFGVNVADGRIKGYPRDMGPGGVAVHYARYVRGDTTYGTNDFIDNGDGTITDLATGLMWMQDDHGGGGGTGPRSGVLWEEALAWVEEKNAENYLGYNDWRLPDAKEMQSIVDYSRAPDATGSAAIDPLFNVTEITNEAGDPDYPYFWTSTTHARADGSGPAAAYICFGRAMGYFGPSGMESWVDVHGAGAQRSDQKDGDFSGYPYAPNGYYFGPQGDALRMYNYVRCVRDADESASADPSAEDPRDDCWLKVQENPFRSELTIRLGLSEDVVGSLTIYDVSGRRVILLRQGRLPEGEEEMVWNGRDEEGREVPAGLYFIRMKAGSLNLTAKAALIR